MRALKKKRLLASILVAVLLSSLVYYAWPGSSTEAPAKNSAIQNSSAASTPIASFDKGQFPVDQAASLWAVVNKGRRLPASYVPAGLVVPNIPLRYGAGAMEMHLRADAAAALQKMAAAASAQGIKLMLASGYRSYGEQSAVYSSYVKSSGVAGADTYSARPGHSEHQTGLAADMEATDRICELDQCFENTSAGKWLAANAYKYGFVIRYPKGSQNLTGYVYEPWHLRYIGDGLATQLQASGQTLEQFFGLSIYTNYPAQSYELKS